MTYLSLFSGIEAATVAWAPLGWRCLAVAEIEKFPAAVLAHHYPDVPNLGDVTTVDWSQWRGKVDVLVGGSPCQAFSVAGLRQSLADPRGNLTLEFVRAADTIQPRFIVWENVPGVLSTSDNAFGCFLAALVGSDDPIVFSDGWPRAGVVDGPTRSACWRVLDAQYFGLAQRRERVFVVASAGNGPHPAEVLLEWEGLRRDSPPSREAGEVAPTIPARSTAGGGLGTDFDCDGGCIPETAMCLNAGGMGRIDGESETFVPVGTFQNTGHGWWNESDVAQTIRTPDGGGSMEANVIAHALRADGFDASEDGTGRGTPLVPVPILEAGARTGVSTTDPRAGIGIGQPGDPMFTLQGGKQHAVAFCERGREQGRTLESQEDLAYALTNPGSGGRTHSRQIMAPTMAVRRLTPTECERLQGFPDGYTLIPYRGKPAADGPRYRALGNSMAVPVMRWIGERIMSAAGGTR